MPSWADSYILGTIHGYMLAGRRTSDRALASFLEHTANAQNA